MLFDFLGAFYLWCYFFVVNGLTKKRRLSFDEILTGKNRYASGDKVDRGAYFLKLKVIGFIVTMILCGILTRF